MGSGEMGLSGALYGRANEPVPSDAGVNLWANGAGGDCSREKSSRPSHPFECDTPPGHGLVRRMEMKRGRDGGAIQSLPEAYGPGRWATRRLCT